jgi:acyl-CoA synthetase (NDP forming)
MTTSKPASPRSPLHDFLAPDSIAIIGASTDPTKRGYKAMVGLIKDGYAAKIYPINPKVDRVLGVKAYPVSGRHSGNGRSGADLHAGFRTLPALLVECGKKGVKGAVILASGFRETGRPEGIQLEQEMLAAARAERRAGHWPEYLGNVQPAQEVNLLALSNVKAGGIGLISQSGNMLLSLVLEAERNGHVGFSTYAGPGNQTDIGFADYLRYLGEDPQNTRLRRCTSKAFVTAVASLRVAREITPAETGGGVQVRINRSWVRRRPVRTPARWPVATR